MSSHFKPRSSYASQKLYSEGDVIDDFYFSTKGVCAFVSEKYDCLLGVIDPLGTLDLESRA